MAGAGALILEVPSIALQGPVTSLRPRTMLRILCGLANAAKLGLRRAGVTGVPTFVDSRGKAFEHAVEAGPTLVAPNVAEAAASLGVTDLVSPREQTRAVRRFSFCGVDWVILTLGSGGAIAAVERRRVAPLAT